MFAEALDASGALQSGGNQPEVEQEVKQAKSNATKDVYGRDEGVFQRVDEKISECCVCVSQLVFSKPYQQELAIEL